MSIVVLFMPLSSWLFHPSVNVVNANVATGDVVMADNILVSLFPSTRRFASYSRGEPSREEMNDEY